MAHSKAPLLEEAFAAYSATLDPASAQTLATIGEMLEENATPAFDTTTLNGAYPIVAAHDENLASLLPQYAAQTRGDAGLVVSANYPAEADRRKVANSLNVLNRFRRENPDLPFAFLDIEYPEDTPIATFRFDLWGGCLAAVRQRARQNLLLISQEADNSNVHPNHAHHMLGAVVPGVVGVRGMASWQRHKHRPHLNLMYNLFEMPWQNFEMGIPSANTAITAEAYLAAHGFNPQDSNSELPLVFRRIPNFDPTKVVTVRHPQAKVITSDRRLWRAALDPDNPLPPWRYDQSLTNTMVDYRENPGTPPRDISKEQAEAWLQDFCTWIFPGVIPYAERRGMSEGWVKARVSMIAGMALKAKVVFDESCAYDIIERTYTSLRST